MKYDYSLPEISYNAKTKIYPDGEKTTICSRAIYKDINYSKDEVTKFEYNVGHILNDLKYPNKYSKTGYFNDDDEAFSNCPFEEKTKESKKEIKLWEQSVKRAKTKIYDIARLNKFDYFVTLTLDQNEIDRYNGNEVSKKLKIYLKNKVARNELKYIMVGENHKDGAIHMHGLMSGSIDLKETKITTLSGQPVFNMNDWKYGFSTAIPTYGDNENTAKYITKYVSKDFKKVFGNYYYAGGNILRNPKTRLENIDFEKIKSTAYCAKSVDIEFKYFEKKGEYENEIRKVEGNRV